MTAIVASAATTKTIGLTTSGDFMARSWTNRFR
jgi:hypothetical protein